MSHWHSGLPKLDIEPFDPTALYDAVRETHAENQELARRRRSRLLPAAIGGAILVVSVTVRALLGALL